VVRASAYADHIVAVSEFTRAQFLEMFPHVSPDKVSVVYEASRFSGPRRSPPPGPVAHLRPGEFWLACGTDDARKNRPRLVQAYAKLRARGETSYPLVLFGGGKLEGDGVHQLGYVDDATLEWLYENCTAFVYPSLFEGFGLPVVEAMSLGAAVLTSNVASLPEVVGGDCALLVDPYDVDALYAELRKLATEPSVKDGLRHRGRERAKRFSWRRAAREVLEIYRQLTNEYAPDGERKALLGAAEHP
jgi:glycosyltransferase involved in cell wall biosynthesis